MGNTMQYIKTITVMSTTQKAIGCKLDITILAELESYCKLNNKKKNTVINEAVLRYLEQN